MTILLFPFFILKLLLYNLRFFLTVFLFKTEHLQAIVIALALFSLTLISLHTAQHRDRHIQNTQGLDKPIDVISINDYFPTKTVSASELTTTYTYLKNLETQQPTHRDLLLNLSTIEYIRGEQETSEIYLEKARQTDPNHPFFSQE